jgi:tetratricopeptide (TPR) repeat protein
MTVTSDTVDSLLEYLDRTQGTDPERLRALLEAALQERSTSPKAPLAYGMAYYHLGDLQNAESQLRLSAEPRAALWLGFTLFDAGKFIEASDHFVRASRALPLQGWTKCKVAELLCCCKLHTTPERVSVPDLEEVTAARRVLPEEDRPVPEELASALTQTAHRLPTSVLRFAAQEFRSEFLEWGLPVPGLTGADK